MPSILLLINRVQAGLMGAEGPSVVIPVRLEVEEGEGSVATAGRISSPESFITVILMLPEAPAISMEVQVEAADWADRALTLMEVLAVEEREVLEVAEVVDTVAVAVAGRSRGLTQIRLIVAAAEVHFLPHLP